MDSPGTGALRFALGDRVACNLGEQGWACGTVVALHYREKSLSRAVPYQIRLDEGSGGAFIFAPMDHPHVIRAEANLPLRTDSVPEGGGDASAALGALARELPAAQALPFVAALSGPELLPVAEANGNLVTPSQSTGPWFLLCHLRGPNDTEYRGTYALRLKLNAAWPASPMECRFASTVRHAAVNEDGLVEAAVLMDAIAAEEERRGSRGSGAGSQSLCSTLRALHYLLHPDSSGLGRRASASNDERWSIIERYEPLRKRARLFDAEQGWAPEWFDPAFAAAAAAGARESEKGFRGIIREEAWEVYSFPLFTLGFCDMLMEEIDAFNASGLPVHRPNSMNNYGVVINEIGLEPMMHRLQREYLEPLARLLFPGQGSLLDQHHSFIVRYKVGEDLGLDMHADDSDITFNVCLGRDFQGAGLQFCGNQGSHDHRHASLLYRHVRGSCVVHKGHRRHGADDITEGERLNLIVWNRNSEYRRSSDHQRHNLQTRATGYERESGPPDRVCVSFTHDRDYGRFKAYTAKTAKHRGHGWCPPRHAEYAAFHAEGEE